MIVRIKYWYKAVLTTLLALLGYGCSSDEPEFFPMYGTPSIDFRFDGQVTDETGTPIQGIKTSVKIVIPLADGRKDVYGQDSVLTDVSGRYQLKHIGMGYETKLIVEDIDGEANGGEFRSDTLDVDVEKAVKVKDGDGSWNMGTYEVHQDIKMKKK